MSIRIEEVLTAKQRKTFIKLPYHLNKNHPNWLPPVYEDDKKFFNPEKNNYIRENEVCMFLAYREKQPVGRIMGIIHKKYNAQHREAAARFAFFESENNQQTADILLNAVANWARQKGMNSLLGPFGFSDKDPQGFLIEGFQETPVIASNCNPPYLVQLTENCGFKGKFDLVVYDIPIPDAVPAMYEKIYKRFTQNNEFQIIEFNSRRELKPYILPIFELTNETFREIYGFQSVTREEALNFANQYLPLLHPAFVKVIEKEKVPVAYVIGMPDISEGLKRARGRLFPLGVLHILRSARKTRKLVLLLGGIREQYRGLGLDAVMGTKIIESAIRLGYKRIDSHLELESNLAVRAEMERLGGKVYKRFRVFERSL